MSLQELYKSGELKERVKKAYHNYKNCTMCPHECRVNRLQGEKGKCGIGRLPKISGSGPHRGEESPLSGWKGSGTIFFSGCNLECVYCQNYDISQKLRGQQVDIEHLAGIMMTLQRRKCHNINLVTPSHVIYPILAALYLAAKKGLELPIVYNSSAYDSQKALELMEGIVDIYMPDFKYGSDEKGKEYSGVQGYFNTASKAVKEMYRQVGKLRVDKSEIAQSGLIIRHLVLPNNAAESDRVMEFIAEELSPDNYINLMRQYYPSYRAGEFPELSRRPRGRELDQARKAARNAGITPHQIPQN